MSAQPGGPAFTPFTSAAVAALPDKRLVLAAFDNIWYQVGDDVAALPRVLAALPPGYSLVYHLVVLDAAIGSGGFNQYFYTGLDQAAPQQAEALRLIGAAAHERVLAEAQALHAAEQSNAALQRLYAERTPEAFAATYRLTALGQWDEAWYALDQTFEPLIAAYLRAHLDLFLPNPPE